MPLYIRLSQTKNKKKQSNKIRPSCTDISNPFKPAICEVLTFTSEIECDSLHNENTID